MGQEETIIFISVLILLLLALTIIILFVVFIKRKNQLISDQEQIRNEFKQELTNSKIEIREETLRNISWELHDNIGQLLTLAKINAQLAENQQSKMNEVVPIIGKALSELRILSKSIDPESLKKLNLNEALSLELERYNRLEYINANLTLEGTSFTIDTNDEVILFRILQEFFINTIKHSKASNLKVNIHYLDTHLIIKANDNGIGYSQADIGNGQGLSNIKNRAKLINAELNMSSNSSQGTSLYIKYSITQSVNNSKK